MNVYDFDGTIYHGDSSLDLYVYCLLRRPWILLLLPKQVCYIIGYKLKLCSKEKAKSVFFSFLKWICCSDNFLERFWDVHSRKLASWYIVQQRNDDVIISASPAFLLSPICRRMNIKYLIASLVDVRDGSFIGKNCYGGEKCIRFRELFPHAQVETFYSDSLSDSPMMQMARESFLVSKDKHIKISFHANISE